MSRIRTIKPDYWTDEKVTELDFAARLLFIGLWNFADDHGRLWYEPKRIKMQIFPSDDVDVTVFLNSLESSGVIQRWETAEGRQFIVIPHFLDHQKVSHPAESKIPLENSRLVPTSRVLQSPPESSRVLAPEGNVFEGNVFEGKGIYIAPSENLPARHTKPPDLLFESIADECGIDWRNLTDTARAKLNKATKEIKAAGGTPDEVRKRVFAYKNRFNVAITEMALAAHWPSLGQQMSVNQLSSSEAHYAMALQEAINEPG